MNRRRILAVVAAASLAAGAAPALGESLPGGPAAPTTLAGSSFAPRVPVSAFARPAAWFDPSRLRVSTTVSVGTGWGGGTDALQVTSLSYQFAAPLAVQLSVGNSFGASAAQYGRGLFLEGLAISYRPHPSFQINVDYRDFRSPLQYSGYPSPYQLGR